MTSALRHRARFYKRQDFAPVRGKQCQSIGNAFEGDLRCYAVLVDFPTACVWYPEQAFLQRERFEVLNKTGLLSYALTHATPSGRVRGSFLSVPLRNTVLDRCLSVKFPFRFYTGFRNEFLERVA